MGRNNQKVVVAMTVSKILRIQELQAIQSSAFVNIHSLYEQIWRPVTDTSRMFEIVNELDHMKARWQAAENELLTLSYCAPLLQRCGVAMHDMYQKKYPINRLTSFVKVDRHLQEVHYYIMDDTQIHFTVPPVVPIAHDRRGVAKMERWAHNSDYYIRLAYAPETNILYWS